MNVVVTRRPGLVGSAVPTVNAILSVLRVLPSAAADLVFETGWVFSQEEKRYLNAHAYL